jgi:RNA methyltransferase, TrmH family
LTYDITSRSNPAVKRLARLADRRHRDAEGVFLVEGRRLFERALAAGLEPLEVYTDGSLGDVSDGVVTIHPDLLDRVSYRSSSEGVIAVFPQYEHRIEDVVPSDPALILVTDSVEKPGNLGAVLRTADAVGADAVIDISRSMDRFNPNLLRSSTGACFTVPTVLSEVSEMVSWLGGLGIALVAAQPGASRTLWEVDLTGPTALMVGAEDTGLSEHARSVSDIEVSIPMAGGLDSLNTSVALALLAYEAVRQRS